MIGSVFAIGAFWPKWYSGILQVSEFASPTLFRFVLFILPLFCFAAVGYVLKFYSSYDVRDSVQYMLFYLVLTAGWLGAAHPLIALMGISARDDVLEGKNAAAIWALFGAFVAISATFAGGNIGNGPGVEVVLFSAGMATAAFFAQWGLLEMLATNSPHESTTIVRDLGAGIRLGGYLAAVGLILGWSVAGDWASLEEAIGDFILHGWSSLLITTVAVLVESAYRPRLAMSGQHILLSLGIAAAYVSGAVVYLLRGGFWG